MAARPRTDPWSDDFGELVERVDNPEMWLGFGSEFVVAPSDVQDQSVVADDGRGGSVPFEHSHGLEPSFESAVIAFDSAVGLLLGVVERVWDRLLDNRL